MQLFGQRDKRWSSWPLGWGPKLGTIGEYGCLDTAFSMIAWDAFTDTRYTPKTMDQVFTSRKVFTRDSSGTYDLLPFNALDMVWPARFRSIHLNGWQPGNVAAAVKSKDTYAILWINSRTVPTHFVIAYSADGSLIADPWTGAVGRLANYGGPAVVKAVILVRKLPLPALPPPSKSTPEPATPAPPAMRPPPLPPPAPPIPQPLPAPLPLPPVAVDYSSQGLLVYLINWWLSLTRRR